MKRLIIIVMLLAAIGTQAFAQLNAGQESKAVSADNLENGLCLGRYDENDVWLNSTRKGWRITALNRDLQVTGTADMEIASERLLAATMSGNAATLLLSAQEKKNTYVLVARLPLEGDATVDTIAAFNMPGRKDKCLLWGATSNLGNYMAVVAVRQFADSAEYAASALLVAPRGNVVYSREFAMTSLDQVFVTDNGCIATLAAENTNSGVDVMVNYVTANVISSGRYTMACDPMREVRIVNVIGNRLLGIATTSARGRRADKAVNGLLTFGYDLDSNKVFNFEAHNFVLEDINTLYNNFIRKKQKTLTAENVSLLGTVPTSYGGAMAITRAFEELKNTNDGVTHHTFMHRGIHIVAVNADGGVAWVTNIRCNDNQENSGDDLHIGITGDGENVYVYKTENRKEPSEYEITRAARVQKAGKRGNLVRYAVGPNGFTEKLILERNSKHNFLLVTDNQEVFTVKGRKVRRATVSEAPATEEPARD